MATVVNRTTFKVVESANSPDYDPTAWIILSRDRDNSDFNALVGGGVPSRYWKVDKDRLAEMDATEKAAADSAATAKADADKAAYETDVKAEAQALIDASAAKSDLVDRATVEQRLRALELRILGA